MKINRNFHEGNWRKLFDLLNTISDEIERLNKAVKILSAWQYKHDKEEYERKRH